MIVYYNILNYFKFIIVKLQLLAFDIKIIFKTQII